MIEQRAGIGEFYPLSRPDYPSYKVGSSLIFRARPQLAFMYPFRGDNAKFIIPCMHQKSTKQAQGGWGWF